MADATGYLRRWNPTWAFVQAQIINEEGRAKMGEGQREESREGRARNLPGLGLGLASGWRCRTRS